MKALASSMMAAALAIAAPGAAAAQGLGFSLQGAFGYGELVRDLDSDGDMTYGAIAGLHFAGPLSLEVEYQHAENDVNGLGGDVTAEQDGVLAHVRFDVLRGPILPFVYGGLGWVQYSLDDTIVDTTDDRAVVPFGAGVEVRLSALLLGVRGEYQWIPNDVASTNTDFWKVVATAGFRIP
jgi:opacity protein-like surface antigen